MRRYLKKSLAFFLALLMALSAMSVMAMAQDAEEAGDALDENMETLADEEAVSAEEVDSLETEIKPLSEIASGTCGPNITWSLDSNGTLTISGTGSMSSYGSSGAAPWADYCSMITTVVMEGEITSIGNSIFYGCNNLETINIPDSVTSIGGNAFYGCSSLKEINIPDSVISIDNGAFAGCSSLENINIPDGVTNIEDFLFQSCSSLSSITISKNVTRIGVYAFAYCTSLTNITFEGSAPTFGTSCFNNVAAVAFYPANNSTWTEEVMQDYGGNILWVTEADMIASGNCGENLIWFLNVDGVLIISGTGDMDEYETSDKQPWAAYQSMILSVMLNDTVTSIGDYAFCGCTSLASIFIPSSVTSIGKAAFSNCSSLASITFEWRAPSIESDSFYLVKATAYYPAGISTWTEDVMQNYGGTLTWESYITATSGTCGNDLTWAFNDGILTISGTGNMDSYMISDLQPWAGLREMIFSVVIDGAVTRIGNYDFYGCINLTEFTIPDSVTSIGYYAFENCSSLTSITIPDSVTSIDGGVFEGCSSLTSVTIPDSVTSISSRLFYNCSSLASITIPESVTSIDSYAFYRCTSLSSITIPENVTSIGMFAFAGCSSLSYITFEGSAPTFDSYCFQNVTAVAFYPADDSTWTEEIMQGYGGTITWTTTSALSGTCGDNLTWVFNDGVLTISGTGDMDFYITADLQPWADLREMIFSVVIEGTVTSLGRYAFYGCTNLTEFTIPDSVTSIGYYAFENCSSLTSITIPDSVTNIDSGTFEGCSSLTNVTIPDSVTSISSRMFYNCSSLASIIIPDSVTSIGSSAFYGCSSLKEINIPDGVTSITSSVLYGCSSLEEIKIPDGVTSIGNSAFYGCSSLEEIKIPDGVTSIGSGAFSRCSNLKYINIPESLARIEDFTFSDCSNLLSITIPENVAGIGVYAFDGCSSLREVNFADGLTSIGIRAFTGCSSLTSVTIPSSVTSIDSSAFYGCSSLEEIVVDAGNTVYSSENGTLLTADKTELILCPEGISSTLYTIPESVTSIGEYAFRNCSNLNNILFKGDAPTFGNGCFQGVTATAYYPPDNSTWTEDVMQNYGGNITWAPAVHTWSNVEWTWSSDYSSATASRTCTVCGEVETAVATVTSKTTSPTCTEPGKTTYTATAEFDGTTYSDEKTVETTPALGHTWGKVMFSWSSDYSSATASRTCSTCNETETVAASVTSKTISPTCTEPGKCVYTATAVFDGIDYTDEVTEETAPAAGHDWNDVVWTWSSDYASATASRTCKVCSYKETVQATVTSEITSEPADGKDGEIVYSASATFSDGTKASVSVSAVLPFTNKEALDEEIEKAEAEVQYKDDFTADSWADFQAALDAAKSVLNDMTATQEDVNEALANLEQAYVNLVPATIGDPFNGFGEKDGNWYYFINGEIAYGMNDVREGTVKGTTGWWYIVNGQVRLDYTGVCDYSNAYGWWYVRNGMVDFGKTGIEQNSYGWWRVVGGKVDFSCNSVEQNDYGWWYLVGGQVQFGYTGVANYANAYGWWYIKGGQVDFSKTSIEPNNFGWWRVVGGKVDFGCNSVEQNDYGWWYVVGGQVQFGYTGVANYANAYGWWYISGGKVDFSRTSVEQNNFGWWRVENGKVNFSFTGWATNNYGRWYCVNGKVDFSRS